MRSSGSREQQVLDESRLTIIRSCQRRCTNKDVANQAKRAHAACCANTAWAQGCLRKAGGE